MAVGKKQKANVNEMIKKVIHIFESFSSMPHNISRFILYYFFYPFCVKIQFPLDDFVIMLFHYDGIVDDWKDLEWSSRAIHLSAISQTKW